MGSSVSTELNTVQEIKFFVQDKPVRVPTNDVTPHTNLAQFLRENMFLTGTKYMCTEGGCGACIVAVERKHPITQRTQKFTVNACLVAVFSCHGWRIYTVEGIGNNLLGYHPIQRQLAKFNGTQCGFCSPGMVMSMYGLTEGKEDFTMMDVESAFGGNMCRCTGYRPILTAFKAMAGDADPEIIGHTNISDIEDIKLCKKTNAPCKETCEDPCDSAKTALYFEKKNVDDPPHWFKVYKLDDVLGLLNKYEDKECMLVGGNTAKGVYKHGHKIDIYIDVNYVTELRAHKLDENLELGANIPLTEMIEIFKRTVQENDKFSYLNQAVIHFNLVAHPAVNNIATMAGNLMIKNNHNDFPSDVFLFMETIGAKLTIVNALDKAETVMSLEEFMTYDMKSKVIKSITLPPMGAEYVFHSYKIMPRAQNAHAMVNAGFAMKLDSAKNVESARIVYGHITPEFVHAKEAETFLVGKPLFNNDSIQGVLAILDKEIKPDEIPAEPSAEYRKQLAIALYYKFILCKAPPDVLTGKNKSGGSMITLERPVSKGLQDFETNESMYPMTQPIPKIEALSQTSGEAGYIIDRTPAPGQLYAAFVEANVTPLSVIDKIDASEALKIPGVVSYLDKDDIPGKNTFTPNVSLYKLVEEELFCSGKVRYHHQPVGLIVATNQFLAFGAAKAVKITYKHSGEKPYFTCRQILKDKVADRIQLESLLRPTKAGNDKKFEVKGKFDIGGQYHFSMETQICAVEPVEENGYNMYPGSQWMDLCQSAAATALKIPESKINIEVRRLGGGFGGKISRAAMVSTACMLAADKLKKPVTMWVPMEKTMSIIGKRFPVSSDYEASINDKGVIQALKNVGYHNYGCYCNELTAGGSIAFMPSGYNKESWYLEANFCITDMPPNTYARSPSACEGLAMTETIMEHLCIKSGLDPYDMRLANIDKNQDHLKKLMKEMLEWSNYRKRQAGVAEFNKNNRWVKKGLAVVPMSYPFEMFGYYNCLVTIFNGDGSVAVSHGGTEMGQGINTKVAQTVAYLFGIPLNMVSVKPSNSLANPNCYPTGGSITSEAVCFAVNKACEVLKNRLASMKEKLKNIPWPDLIAIAYLQGVDLSASSLCFPKSDMKVYEIYGVGIAEVTVDVLTGLQQITRFDIIEDVGNSMSPNIDIGQIEGAVVMGLGYWMTENLVYDDEDGSIINTRTWNYKPPGAKDIPIDFRVRLEKNAPNPVGVFKSKAVAEPPLLMAFAVPLALRRALASARSDSQADADKWVPLNGVSSPEYTFMNSLNDYKQYTL